MTSSDSPLCQGSATPALRPSYRVQALTLWRSRHILRLLVVRDLKLRYSDSVLGYVWTLLDPFLLALVYWFVFGVIVARGAPNEQPYLLWLLTGILPFQWTAHVMNDSGRLLGNDAKLVTASTLPREIWVLRTVLSRFVEFLFTLPITVLAMIFFGVWPRVEWLLVVPAAFVVQIIFNAGLGLMLSPLSMLYPDVQRLVRVFTLLYRYLSPVIYSVATLELALQEVDNWPSWMLVGDETWPSWIMDLYALNPLTGILDVYHAVLFTGSGTIGLLGVAAAVSVLTLAVGWWLFRRLESRVLKEI